MAHSDHEPSLHGNVSVADFIQRKREHTRGDSPNRRNRSPGFVGSIPLRLKMSVTFSGSRSGSVDGIYQRGVAHV